MKRRRAVFPLLIPGLAGLLLSSGSLPAETFLLPTANRALLHRGHEEEFFVGTSGKPWTSGTFGCVRSDGWQMHEGLDIRCQQRDRRNEPLDPVMATADGVVAYINARPSLSNYGNYIVLRHQIEGLEVYSLYAHLHEIRAGLKANASVKAGEPIAVMGRTSNTRERISKERAHVHFELDFLANERFAAWHNKTNPKERNDHGDWNGQNLIGIDPSRVLLAQQDQGEKFKLLKFVQTQPELCRVQVLATSFPWLKRYPAVIERNARAEKEGVAGYEMALNLTGLPFLVIPRASSELKAKTKFHLVSVNEAEQQKNPCRRLVAKRSGHWELGSHGLELLDLLTF